MKLHQPLISIIVPVYNAEKFLRRCVSSIQKQTIYNIEILLIDDGSTDKSYELCRVLASEDKRIHVFHKENGGAASARNLGLDAAVGKYVGFVDSDDYIEPTMYEELLECIQQGGYKMVDCLAKVFSDTGELTEEPLQNDGIIIQTAEEAIQQSLLCKENVSLGTRLFLRETIGDRRIPTGRRVEDFIFMIYTFDNVGYNIILQKCLYNIVATKGSVTRSGGGTIYLDALFYLEEVVIKFTDKGYQLQDAINYYRLKMTYLLLVSITREEYDNCRLKFDSYRSELMRHMIRMMINRHLRIKEKFILILGCISATLPHKLYCIKSHLSN